MFDLLWRMGFRPPEAAPHSQNQSTGTAFADAKKAWRPAP